MVISYGNCAGPHDGSSLIETAFNELLASRRKNFSIVLAGGNSRRDSGHVRRHVVRDRSALLRLRLADGDITDTFVEAWYPANAGHAGLQVRVRGPGQVWSAWIGFGEEQVLRAATAEREVVGLLRHDRYVPNGERAMVLLALAPTQAPPGVDCPLNEPGVWELEFRLSDPAAEDIILEAWIERDDPARGSNALRNAFIDQDIDDEWNTVSSIATGTLTLKAFGFNRGSDRPAPYSSLPKAGADDPLRELAVCEDDQVHPNLAAAATRSGDTFRMQGTSVAAPVLARRAYDVMAASKAPVDLDDWDQVVEALCRDDPTGPIQPFRKDGTLKDSERSSSALDPQSPRGPRRA